MGWRSGGVSYETSRVMYALAPKRCPHCVGVLSTVQLDHADEFRLRGSVVIGERCDSVPGRMRCCSRPTTGIELSEAAWCARRDLLDARPNMSCGLNAMRSARESVSSTISSASPIESASRASCSGAHAREHCGEPAPQVLDGVRV